jgi:hypothetical protein
MQYPGAPATIASPNAWAHLRLTFHPIPSAAQQSPAAAAAVAHAAGHKTSSPPALSVGEDLSAAEWGRLFTQLSTLHAPAVPVTRSSSAVPDKPAAVVPPIH